MIEVIGQPSSSAARFAFFRSRIAAILALCIALFFARLFIEDPLLWPLGL